MKDTSSLNSFPKRQIKPYDGMSITADVWTEAHEEHRQTERAHNLFLHGSGIVTGLEVVANDPPDKYIFISPGVAIDPAGNVIELDEPVAYDFGDTAEGELTLFLGHGEREIGGVQTDIRYNQKEFVIAARSNIPKRPAVELGRVILSGTNKPIKNATNPHHPQQDEVDLRFRKVIGARKPRPIRVGLGHFESAYPDVLLGWDFLSQELERAAPYRLIIDCDIPVTSVLLHFELVYFAGAGTWNLSNSEVKALEQYLDQGKTLLLEALDEAAQDSCQGLLEQLKRKLDPLKDNDKILTHPYLFHAPPDGVIGNQVFLGPQVVYTNAGYSPTWAGKTRNGKASRSEIRTAHEWGVNMLTYCLENTKD